MEEDGHGDSIPTGYAVRTPEEAREWLRQEPYWGTRDYMEIGLKDPPKKPTPPSNILVREGTKKERKKIEIGLKDPPKKPTPPSNVLVREGTTKERKKT